MPLLLTSMKGRPAPATSTVSSRGQPFPPFRPRWMAQQHGQQDHGGQQQAQEHDVPQCQAAGDAEAGGNQAGRPQDHGKQGGGGAQQAGGVGAGLRRGRGEAAVSGHGLESGMAEWRQDVAVLAGMSLLFMPALP
jgi:hypothetical protein